ncbi:MAG: hypothetical protein WCR01_02770 [Bacteroidota bacterium]
MSKLKKNTKKQIQRKIAGSGNTGKFNLNAVLGILLFLMFSGQIMADPGDSLVNGARTEKKDRKLRIRIYSSVISPTGAPRRRPPRQP